MSPALPYKISVLVFIENHAGEQLLMLRAKQPNLGVWTPLGGKLEMATGESPLQCAVRETAEEAGLVVREEDMHLFAMIAEKAETTAVVGHEPWIGELVAWLVFGDVRRGEGLALKKGSVAILSNSGNFTTTIATYLRMAGWGTTTLISSGKDVYIHYAAPEFAFALAAMVALLHDILMTVGFYAIVGREVTLVTVVAVLTVLGYSLYDTIIIFDRIRENSPRVGYNCRRFDQTIHDSIRQVVRRSIYTSLCTLIPLTALLIFGEATLAACSTHQV